LEKSFRSFSFINIFDALIKGIFMSNIKVSIVNQCSVLQDAEVKPVVAALQTQVTRDFAPIWGIDADLIFVPKSENADPNTWWLILLDDSDTDGALGYHELNPAGLPMAKVFAKTDLKYNMKWSVTTSHELLEMLADPDINLTAFIQTGNESGYLYAFEMCDPVEDDQYGYMIDGVSVSNFILPSYFQESIPANKWDFCGYLKGGVPSMLSGGYLSKFAVGQKHETSGWTQITAEKIVEGSELKSRAARQLPSSRRKKRANKRVSV
jgi:hypothetical protein